MTYITKIQAFINLMELSKFFHNTQLLFFHGYCRKACFFESISSRRCFKLSYYFSPSAYEPKPEGKGEDKQKKAPLLWKPTSPGGLFNPKPYATHSRREWVTYINTYPAVWSRGTFIPNSPTKSVSGT